MRNAYPAVLVTLSLVLISCAGGVAPEQAAEPDAAAPPEPNTVVFTRSSGGSVRTNLGYGIVLNAKSTLEREWVTAQDTLLPARLVGTVGVRTAYDPGGRYSSGQYEYRATVPIEAIDSLSAVEVRIVPFDVWGEFLKTLSMTEVEDIPAGVTREFTPRWRLYSENEASEVYASIAYIARLRTSAGRVYQTESGAIVEEARRFSERFSPEQLDPLRRSPRDTAATLAAAGGAL